MRHVSLMNLVMFLLIQLFNHNIFIILAIYSAPNGTQVSFLFECHLAVTSLRPCDDPLTAAPLFR